VHPSDGVGACLKELKASGLRLGIICDIGLTPSFVVRELLERRNLLRYFDDAVFSDEVDLYKPDPRIFALALQRLGNVPSSASVHIGDRRRTDVGGAVRAGMGAIRYRRVYDDPAPDPEGHVVVDDLAQLPGILLGRRRPS